MQLELEKPEARLDAVKREMEAIKKLDVTEEKRVETLTMMNSTVQAMLNALDFELEMLGKTTEERERAVSQAQFQVAIQGMLGEEILKTVEGQIRYNELMDEYVEKLNLVNERVREINEKIDESQQGWNAVGNAIDVWGERATNWGQRLGEVLVNAFDDASYAFADMLMKEEVDWKAFGRMFVKELLAMIIKLQMAIALKAVLGFGGGLLGPLTGSSMPTGPVFQPSSATTPGLQRGGAVLKTGLAVIHEGETFTSRNKQNENKVQVNVNNYTKAETEIDEYMYSDQRIIDVSIGAAGGNGSYRRSHRKL